jgi:hypothetical protein
MRILKLALYVALIPLSAFLPAQDQAKIPVFRREVNLATVLFRHVEKRTTTDLRPEDIVLLVDGRPREITLFEGGPTARRSVPLEITWLVDRFSLLPIVPHYGRNDEMDLRSFHNSMLELIDKFPMVFHSIYGFDKKLWRFCGPTRDTAEISKAIQALRGEVPAVPEIGLQMLPGRKLRDPWAKEACEKINPGEKCGPFPQDDWVFESIIATLQDSAGFPGNTVRALVPISFGHGGTNSTAKDIEAMVKQAGSPIYPVVLGYMMYEADILAWSRLTAVYQDLEAKNAGTVRAGSNRTTIRNYESAITFVEQELSYKNDFASLAEMSGGEAFRCGSVLKSDMESIIHTIEEQVRHQYVAGFAPEVSSGMPQKHTLEVKLISKTRGKILGGKRTIWY